NLWKVHRSSGVTSQKRTSGSGNNFRVAHGLGNYREVSGMVLLIAADSPPIQLFELGHLFGPVLRIPVSPSRYIGRQSCVSDLLQREERPVAHLRGSLGIPG